MKAIGHHGAQGVRSMVVVERENDARGATFLTLASLASTR